MKQKLIETWDELSKLEPSETHHLDIEDHCGWILKNGSNELEHYLSTHTFYGSMHEFSTAILQECGFNVTLSNWDA